MEPKRGIAAAIARGTGRVLGGIVIATTGLWGCLALLYGPSDNAWMQLFAAHACWLKWKATGPLSSWRMTMERFRNVYKTPGAFSPNMA